MNIFIDTNIYLSFYHFSSDDLEELKKLVALARKKHIVLFLPEQVIDEFERNRAGKIADAIKRIREQRRSLQLPQISRQYEEYSKLKDVQAEYDKYLTALIEMIEGDIVGKNFEADTVIKELFQVARRIPLTENMISKARLRMELGKPPGKKGSLGDAINWISLLEEVKQGEDISLVTGDDDYSSPLNISQIEPYLKNEWNSSKQSEIHYFKRLSELLVMSFPDIRLATEFEKEILIQELAESPNFRTTHTITAKLLQFSDFNRTQANDIITAAVTNNQVYWIAKDPTMMYFFTTFLNNREHLIDPENLKRLKFAMEELEPYHNIPF